MLDLTVTRLLPLRAFRRGMEAGFALFLGCWCFAGQLLAAETDWVLRGTVVTEAPYGYAIIESAATGEQRWIGQDQALPEDGIRLTAVYADHARVEDASGERRLEFGMRVARPSRTSSARYQIQRDEIHQWVPHLDLIPHQQDGQVVGYFANGIPEELRDRIGLQPGDLVQTVNGVPLNNSVDPMLLYQQVNQPVVTLGVTRRGEPVQLVYQLD